MPDLKLGGSDFIVSIAELRSLIAIAGVDTAASVRVSQILTGASESPPQPFIDSAQNQRHVFLHRKEKRLGIGAAEILPLAVSGGASRGIERIAAAMRERVE